MEQSLSYKLTSLAGSSILRLASVKMRLSNIFMIPMCASVTPLHFALLPSDCKRVKTALGTDQEQYESFNCLELSGMNVSLKD